MISWLEDWLNYWPQEVVTRNEKSNWKVVIGSVPQVFVLGEMLFNTLTNNVTDRIEGILRMTVHNIFGGPDYTGIAQTLEVRAAIQINYCTGISMFYKAKCKALYLGRNNHMEQYWLENSYLKSRFSKEIQNLGLPVDKLNMSPKYTLAAKTDHMPG